uniref:SnoaL-like domain-containing protein n=1 Tax=Caenorhabditis tropicalis TaxID=1561998 RepID=A0A1I7T8N0_9PELO
MNLLLILLISIQIVQIENAVNANIVSDPRSLFPKVSRTKSAFHFLHFFMGTFRHMFDKNKTETINHFNYYDDQVKGNDCHIKGELDFTRLKDYFDKYVRTHRDPQITVIYAVMSKDGVHMTVDFHVTSKTWLGYRDHFHMIIRAFNDETVGWGVRRLNMAINC